MISCLKSCIRNGIQSRSHHILQCIQVFMAGLFSIQRWWSSQLTIIWYIEDMVFLTLPLFSMGKSLISSKFYTILIDFKVEFQSISQIPLRTGCSYRSNPCISIKSQDFITIPKINPSHHSHPTNISIKLQERNFTILVKCRSRRFPTFSFRLPNICILCSCNRRRVFSM